VLVVLHIDKFVMGIWGCLDAAFEAVWHVIHDVRDLGVDLYKKIIHR
jgi:hypothetical protein